MLRWFQALMPKQGSFYELFEAHAAILVSGADTLGRLLQGGPDIAAQVAEIKRLEGEADGIIRSVLNDTRRTLITPFDRAAIFALITSMDDAIDQMNSAANAVTLYGVTEFPAQMRDLSGVIVEAARIGAEAVPLLREVNTNSTRITELTTRMVELEQTADEIHDGGVKALYEALGNEPMQFVVMREIYGSLERVVDRFEDMANEIQGLVLDHA